MKRGSVLKAALWLLASAALPVSSAFAEESSEQIRQLERKFDALMELVGQQQQTIDRLLDERDTSKGKFQDGAKGREVSDANGVLQEPHMVSGMQLSVCPLKLGKDRRLPDTCQTLPPATIMVTPTDRFGFDAAMEDRNLSDFAKVLDRELVGLRWTANLSVAKPGPHNFQLAFRYFGNEGAGNVTCRSVFRLAGHNVVQASAKFVSDGSNSVVTEQGYQVLEPGLYEVEVFLACFVAYDRLRNVFPLSNAKPDLTKYLNGVEVQLSFAEPGDKTFRAIPANRIGITQ